MIENIIAVVVILSFAVYFNYSVKLVDKINDKVTFNNLTLRKVLSNLSSLKKVALVFCLPIVLPVGFLIYIVNLILYRNVR